MAMTRHSALLPVTAQMPVFHCLGFTEDFILLEVRLKVNLADFALQRSD